MNELLKVNYDNDKLTVSARELHEKLNIEKRFSAWFETNSKGFVEGQDFTSVLSGTVVNNGANRELKDYNMDVDMAKHICLMSRTEKGKQIRQYFIGLEKKWNSPEFVMNRALEISRKQVERLLSENNEMKPKALFADSVSASESSILIGDLAKLIKQNGVNIGQNRLFAWLRDNGYLVKNGESRNLPTQKSMNLELMEIKERTVNNPDGSIRITKTTKITGKGQIYFVNKLNKQAEIQA